ncbi:MAG: cation:proton antiporter [Acidobacteriaceae bacterium]
MLTDWFVLAGAVALVLSFSIGLVRRSPLTTSILYLGVGYLVGPKVFGLLIPNPQLHSQAIEWLTAVVITTSIFSSALKLRVPVFDRRWIDPLRLVFVAMLLTIAGALAVGHYILGLAPVEAFVLATILSPTDPVLASDVQVEDTYTYHRLRFSLTGEAGVNDGIALPLMVLGLSLLGATPKLQVGNWILVHVIWGISGGLLIGGVLGYLGARYMLHLRVVHKDRTGGDRFLALGLAALSYGLAEKAHAIGFVAVFAAGVAVSEVELQMREEPPEFLELKVTGRTSEQEVAVDEEKGPAFMLLRMRSFTETLERLGQAVVVILLGSLIRSSMFTAGTLIFAALLFFAIRPLSVIAGFVGAGMPWPEKAMSAWFGIRGMASLYYLAYLKTRGVSGALVEQLADVVIAVIVCSIVLHGVSVTPLMRWFEHLRGERE